MIASIFLSLPSSINCSIKSSLRVQHIHPFDNSIIVVLVLVLVLFVVVEVVLVLVV